MLVNVYCLCLVISSFHQFFLYFFVYDYSEGYIFILGLGLQRAGGIHEGQLVGGFRLHLGVWLGDRRYTSG